MCLPPEEKEDENMRKTISLFSKDTLHRIPFTPLSKSRSQYVDAEDGRI